MAPCLFADAIMNGRALQLFNGGDMSRDFTYIDDIVEGTYRIAMAESSPQPVYNIGCGSPQALSLFLQTLQSALGREAIVEKAPMQPGDVVRTWADTSALERDFGYRPAVSLAEGISHFADWFKEVYTKI